MKVVLYENDILNNVKKVKLPVNIHWHKVSFQDNTIHLSLSVDIIIGNLDGDIDINLSLVSQQSQHLIVKVLKGSVQGVDIKDIVLGFFDALKIPKELVIQIDKNTFSINIPAFVKVNDLSTGVDGTQTFLKAEGDVDVMALMALLPKQQSPNK